MTMRRFLFILFLLFLTLLIGRELEAAPPASWEYQRGSSLHVGGDLEFGDEDDWDRRRGRTYPRRRGDSVVFRLPDRGYEAVSLAGDFSDWESIPMEFVERREYWEATVELGPGSHRYVYIVEDAHGGRERKDPANPRRARHEGRWVSELVIGKGHRVLRPRDEYDFDLLSNMRADFQRVDGFSLYTRPRFRSRTAWSPSLDASLGYGFSSEEWSGALTFTQPMLASGEIGLSLSLYDQTDYTDQTGVGDLENALGSWIFREDNRDYYRREGISIGLVTRPADGLDLDVQFRSDDYHSQEVVTTAGWNLGREPFLPNPAVDERPMRSLLARAQFGEEYHHLRLSYEISNGDLFSTDHDFEQITAQYRTRLRMGRRQRLDLRIKAGSNLSGSLPQQKRYIVGGIGTVRGYRYQSLLTPDPAIVRGPGDALPLGGERMFLFNAEYSTAVEPDMSVVLFFDSGMAWEDREADIDPEDFVSSIGVGIVLDDDDDEDALRFDLIKALDDDDDGEIMLQARLSRPF